MISASLEEKKAENIALLDVRGKTGITDFFVFANGMSPPHLKALSEAARLAAKEEGVSCYRKAGSSEAGWMALDFVDVITHIFLPEARDYYRIEDLWVESPPPG